MADREVLKRRFVPAPLALAAWLLVLACSLAPAPALADGHFRYGTLSWAPSASGTENAVDFTLQVAYKKTYVWGGGLESWKENDDTPGSGFRNLAQAAAEDKAACDAWDKSGPRPEARGLPGADDLAGGRPRHQVSSQGPAVRGPVL